MYAFFDVWLCIKALVGGGGGMNVILRNYSTIIACILKLAYSAFTGVNLSDFVDLKGFFQN